MDIKYGSKGTIERLIELLSDAGMTLEQARHLRCEDAAKWVKGLPTVWTRPEWWPSAPEQLERACRSWPGVAFPAPPRHFNPITNSEQLLLHVPGTFSELLGKIDPPHFHKFTNDQELSDENVRSLPGSFEYDGPKWVGFDYMFGIDQSLEDVQKLVGSTVSLAGAEALSAMILAPEWVEALWSRNPHYSSPSPRLGGYEVVKGKTRSGTPGFSVNENGFKTHRWLHLCTFHGEASSTIATPFVRQILQW